MQMWQIMVAVLAANLLTAMFLYGAYHAARIYDDRDLKAPVIASLLLPLGIIGLGVIAYGW